MNTPNDTGREIFIAGLRNAHAVENQAVSLIKRQLDRIENYPEVAERPVAASAGNQRSDPEAGRHSRPSGRKQLDVEGRWRDPDRQHGGAWTYVRPG